MRQILLQIRPPHAAQAKDHFLWGDSSNQSSFFSTRRTWEALRNHAGIQTWANLIWCRRTIPKHSFLMWVITLDRLPLRTRLARWGVIDTDTCCVCSGNPENREHLFLKCDFALQIWEWLGRKLSTACTFSSWDSFLLWLGSAPTKEKSVLRIISAQALVYAIWRERNNRFHNATSTTANNIIAALDKMVRQALLAAIGKRLYGKILSLWFAYF